MSRGLAFVIRNASLISPQSPRFQFTILDRPARYCGPWIKYDPAIIKVIPLLPRVNDLFKLAYRTGESSAGLLNKWFTSQTVEETRPQDGGFFRGTHSSLFARTPARVHLWAYIPCTRLAQYEIQRPSVLVASSQPPRGNDIFQADDNRIFSPIVLTYISFGIASELTTAANGSLHVTSK